MLLHDFMCTNKSCGLVFEAWTVDSKSVVCPDCLQPAEKQFRALAIIGRKYSKSVDYDNYTFEEQVKEARLHLARAEERGELDEFYNDKKPEDFVLEDNAPQGFEREWDEEFAIVKHNSIEGELKEIDSKIDELHREVENLSPNTKAEVRSILSSRAEADDFARNAVPGETTVTEGKSGTRAIAVKAEA